MINFRYQIVRYMQIESLFSQMAEHTKDDLMDSPSTPRSRDPLKVLNPLKVLKDQICWVCKDHSGFYFKDGLRDQYSGRDNLRKNILQR